MMHSGYRPALRSIAVLLCLLALTACGHIRMPWSKKPVAPPEPVHELTVTGADGAPATAFPQYWKRNTLVVDLQSASGSGSVTLKPGEAAKWPVRIALRVRPGTVGLLEVQADQRMILPVTREGDKPVDLELVPGVYTPKSPQMVVRWEPAKTP